MREAATQSACWRHASHLPPLFGWPRPRRRSTFLGRLKPVSSRLSLLLPAALPVASELGAHAVSGPAAARAVLQKGLTSVQASTCKPRWGQSFTFVINSRHQVGAARPGLFRVWAGTRWHAKMRLFASARTT